MALTISGDVELYTKSTMGLSTLYNGTIKVLDGSTLTLFGSYKGTIITVGTGKVIYMNRTTALATKIIDKPDGSTEYLSYHPDTGYLATKVIGNADGSNEHWTYYRDTGSLAAKTLSVPDPYGNILYNYNNDAQDGAEQGSLASVKRQSADADRCMSYTYANVAGTDLLHKYGYANNDFTNLLVVKEYDSTGTLRSAAYADGTVKTYVPLADGKVMEVEGEKATTPFTVGNADITLQHNRATSAYAEATKSIYSSQQGMVTANTNTFTGTPAVK